MSMSTGDREITAFIYGRLRSGRLLDSPPRRSHTDQLHNCAMKPAPTQLPAANSRKWHARRLWDPLGYIRVRSLSNPHWHRDSAWLVQIMTAERAYAPQAERALYDRAIAAARSYPRTSSGGIAVDEAWDEVLTAIDELLVLRQERHLADVRQAGCSS